MREPLEVLRNGAPTQQAADPPLSVANNAPANNGQGSAGPTNTTQPKKPKRKLTAAERKLQKPPKDPNVPINDRISDEELVKIGRLYWAYTRHCMAPYAFVYTKGKLSLDYYHLAEKRDQDDNYVWDDKVIRRLLKREKADRILAARTN